MTSPIQPPSNLASLSEQLSDIVIREHGGPSVACMHRQSIETVLDSSAFKRSHFARETRAKATKALIAVFERRRLRDGWFVAALMLVDRLNSLNSSAERRARKPDELVVELMAAVLITLKIAPAEAELDMNLRDIVHEVAGVAPNDNAWWKKVAQAEYDTCVKLQWRVAGPNPLEISQILALHAAAAVGADSEKAWSGFVMGRLSSPNPQAEPAIPRFALLSAYIVEIGIIEVPEEMYRDATPAAAVAVAAVHLALHSFGSPPPASCLDSLQDAQLQSLGDESPVLMRRLVGVLHRAWQGLPTSSPIAEKWRSRARSLGGFLPPAPKRGSFPQSLVWKQLEAVPSTPIVSVSSRSAAVGEDTPTSISTPPPRVVPAVGLEPASQPKCERIPQEPLEPDDSVSLLKGNQGSKHDYLCDGNAAPSSCSRSYNGSVDGNVQNKAGLAEVPSEITDSMYSVETPVSVRSDVLEGASVVESRAAVHTEAVVDTQVPATRAVQVPSEITDNMYSASIQSDVLEGASVVESRDAVHTEAVVDTQMPATRALQVVQAESRAVSAAATVETFPVVSDRSPKIACTSVTSVHISDNSSEDGSSDSSSDNSSDDEASGCSSDNDACADVADVVENHYVQPIRTTEDVFEEASLKRESSSCKTLVVGPRGAFEPERLASACKRQRKNKDAALDEKHRFVEADLALVGPESPSESCAANCIGDTSDMLSVAEVFSVDASCKVAQAPAEEGVDVGSNIVEQSAGLVVTEPLADFHHQPIGLGFQDDEACVLALIARAAEARNKFQIGVEKNTDLAKDVVHLPATVPMPDKVEMLTKGSEKFGKPSLLKRRSKVGADITCMPSRISKQEVSSTSSSAERCIPVLQNSASSSPLRSHISLQQLSVGSASMDSRVPLPQAPASSEPARNQLVMPQADTRSASPVSQPGIDSLSTESQSQLPVARSDLLSAAGSIPLPQSGDCSTWSETSTKLQLSSGSSASQDDVVPLRQASACSAATENKVRLGQTDTCSLSTTINLSQVGVGPSATHLRLRRPQSRSKVEAEQHTSIPSVAQDTVVKAPEVAKVPIGDVGWVKKEAPLEPWATGQALAHGQEGGSELVIRRRLKRHVAIPAQPDVPAEVQTDSVCTTVTQAAEPVSSGQPLKRRRAASYVPPVVPTRVSSRISLSQANQPASSAEPLRRTRRVVSYVPPEVATATRAASTSQLSQATQPPSYGEPLRRTRRVVSHVPPEVATATRAASTSQLSQANSPASSTQSFKRLKRATCYMPPTVAPTARLASCSTALEAKDHVAPADDPCVDELPLTDERVFGQTKAWKPRVFMTGEASRLEGKIAFDGQWAEHSLPTQDDFGKQFSWFASMSADGRPINGKCDGWYMLPSGDKPKQFEETTLTLQFKETCGGGYIVSGEGKNRHLRNFKVSGTLNADNSFQLQKLTR